MLLSYILFVVGFVLLVKGADYLIDGGVEIAALLGVSPLFIGLSIAALGTSAPEAAVSIKAAIIEHSTISFGNILGSNIANIGLIIGLMTVLYSLEAQVSTIKWEVPYSISITLLLLLLVRDDLFGGHLLVLSRINGFILLLFFLFYLIYLYRMARRDRRRKLLRADVSSIEHTKKELMKAIGMTVLGLVGLLLGAKFVVDNAISIAKQWGVSETMISVTVIALGTSLPELATSLAAARKRKFDIAIGNIVGSNIFNILFVLGITSLIRPIIFPLRATIDIFIVLAISVLLLVFIYTGNRVSRKEGVFMLLFYIFYIIFAIIRR